MVLYFYSLLSIYDGKTTYSSGTLEASKEIASHDEFSDALDGMCEKHNVDRSKTVVTAFNRI